MRALEPGTARTAADTPLLEEAVYGDLEQMRRNARTGGIAGAVMVAVAATAAAGVLAYHGLWAVVSLPLVLGAALGATIYLASTRRDYPTEPQIVRVLPGWLQIAYRGRVHSVPAGAIRGYHLRTGMPSAEYGSLLAVHGYTPGRYVSVRAPGLPDAWVTGAVLPGASPSLGLDLDTPEGDHQIVIVHTTDDQALRDALAHAGGPPPDAVLTVENHRVG